MRSTTDPSDGRDLLRQLLDGEIQMHLLGLGVPHGLLFFDHDGISVGRDVEGAEGLILRELPAERAENPLHPAQGNAGLHQVSCCSEDNDVGEGELVLVSAAALRVDEH